MAEPTSQDVARMSSLRFNHVFLALLFLSALFSFVLPPNWSNVVRGRLDWLFAPVSYPVRKIAANVTGKIVDQSPSAADAATPEEARREIEKLRVQVVNLTSQVDELSRLKGIQELAGPVGELCRPFRVIGGDGAGQDTLAISLSGSDEVKVGMPVLHQTMLVGRVSSVGSGGARIKLITDRGSRMDGQVYYWSKQHQQLVKRPTPALLVEGIGGGAMQVTNLKMKDVKEAGIVAGDWVQLTDQDWPGVVHGMVMGEVEKVEGYAKGPGFALITVRPRASLPQLTDVLVVTEVRVPSVAAAPKQNATATQKGNVQVKKVASGRR